jgi:hypothetical protein
MTPGEFDILAAAGAGMEAQRAALDLAARNVAASEADGTGFARLVPRYAIASSDDGSLAPDEGAFEPPEPDPAGLALVGDFDSSSAGSVPIRYLGAAVERGRAPDAVTEMVAVLDAQRAYDENASVFDAGKRLAERTIDAGRLQ